MKLSVNKSDGTEIQLVIGISAIVSASQKIREAKQGIFEDALAKIAKSDIKDSVAENVILAALADFTQGQLPDDMEAAKWLRTWEGKVAAIEHGTRNTAKLSYSEAQELADELSAADYAKIVLAIDCLIDGEDAAKIRASNLKAIIEMQQLQLDRQLSLNEGERYRLEMQKTQTAQLKEQASKQASKPAYYHFPA